MLATTAQCPTGSLSKDATYIDIYRYSAGTLSPAAELWRPPLELNLRSRHCGAVIIVSCEGRIVYRDETAVLSRVVRQALQHSAEVVLDLEGVRTIDGAGLGELVLLHLWATAQEKALKLVGGSRWVLQLLELTNLSSVLASYSSLAEATESCLEPLPSTLFGDAAFNSIDA